MLYIKFTAITER